MGNGLAWSNRQAEIIAGRGILPLVLQGDGGGGVSAENAEFDRRQVVEYIPKLS